MDLMKQLEPYENIVEKSSLLAGIDRSRYEEALNLMDASIHTASKNEHLIDLGDPFPRAFYLLEGSLEGSFFNESYDQIILNQFLPGSIIGESFSCIRKGSRPIASPVRLRAECGSVYLSLDLIRLRSQCSGCSSVHHELLANLMLEFAQKNVFLQKKVRILSQKNTRDRIMLYLSSLPKSKKGFVTLPFSKTALSEFLGLNRSSMSRELSRMEEDGLIRVDGRRIYIS